MVPVTIFNTSTLNVIMQVNNGQQFQIAGVSASGQPQVPAFGGPGWSYAGAAPNVLAPGANSLMLAPSGMPRPLMTTLTLPGDVQWNALQVYLFFSTYSDVSWVVLNQGQYVVGNLRLGQSGLDKGAPGETA